MEMTGPRMARLDRPWHRPGAARYGLRRLPGLLRPPVSVYEPAGDALSVLRDVPVVTRDGTTLRVNVVLPAGAGPFPVLMSAHPYGKDDLPRRRGLGYRVSIQYRVLRQTGRVRFSSLTGWEAPDPRPTRPGGRHTATRWSTVIYVVLALRRAWPSCCPTRKARMSMT